MGLGGWGIDSVRPYKDFLAFTPIKMGSHRRVWAERSVMI